MPSPVVFWIVPPEPLLVLPASPVIVSPPLAPVLLSTMPFDGAVGRDALEGHIAAPMVVLATLSAVPVPELMVLPVPCTVTVPPPVALKPMPDGGGDVEAVAAGRRR